MKKKLFNVILVFVVLFSSVSLYAEKKRYAITLNYPGIGFKYIKNETIGFEGKIQAEEGVTLLGGRGYYFFNKKHNILPSAGIELDMVTFTGELSKGTGFTLEVFGCGEYFIKDSISVQFDLGPVIIMLSDKNYDVSDTGLEFTYNLGINFYFGK